MYVACLYVCIYVCMYVCMITVISLFFPLVVKRIVFSLLNDDRQ